MQFAKNPLVDWPEVDLELSLISRLREGERGGPSPDRALRPLGLLAGTGIPYTVQGDSLVGVLVFSNVVFNLTDLATTFAAVGRGLAGVGPLVTSMSSMTGLSLFAALLMTKAPPTFVTSVVVGSMVPNWNCPVSVVPLNGLPFAVRRSQVLSRYPDRPSFPQAGSLSLYPPRTPLPGAAR